MAYSIRRSSRTKGGDQPHEQDRTTGLTKSVVKRKRTVDRDEHEVDFTFTPTHPDKKKARTAASSSDEPPAARSTRPTSSRKKAAAAEAAKTPASSRSLRNQVQVGVTTQIPSKASLEEPGKGSTEELEISTASSPVERTSKSAKTPEKSPPKPRTSPNIRKPDNTNDTAPKSPPKPTSPKKVAPASPTEPNPDIAISPSQSKKRKTLSIANPEDIRETEVQSPKKAKTAKTATSSSSKSSKLESTPPIHPESAPVDKIPPKEPEATKPKAIVSLEENPVSYWDFVKPKRGDALIKRLVKLNNDGTRRLSEAAEETLRVVQSRFYEEAESLYRPEDMYIPNPVNEELETAQEYYQRIIELLEKENEALEATQRRVLSQLESLSVSPSTSTSSTTPPGEAPKTPKSAAARRKSAPKSAKKKSSVNEEQVEKTDAEVAEIMKNMPPVETLLSEEEKDFLAFRPALASNLQLAGFSRLQTKLDSLQLLIKQIGYVNSTFEEKAIGISGAMRSYMVPSASASSAVNFSKIPVSSPLLRK